MAVPSELWIFLQAEWDRFWDGLDRLTPEEQARARIRAAERGRAPGDPAVVRIPRWDDVVHLRPRVQITPNERRDHFRALRENRPSPLSSEKVGELERRRGVFTAIRDAAQPEYSKAWGQVLTAIDNVQDFTTTISTLGRLVLWPASRLAPKVFARLLPGLGWILLLSDLLNLLGFLGMLALPAYAALCRGPREALAAAVPAALFGRALKSETHTLKEFNPFSRRARTKRRLRLLRRLPGIGSILEVLQTTDQLWGVGLSFGALVGAIMNAAYGVERAARGERVEVRTPQAAHEMRRLLGPALAVASNTNLRERQRAAAVLAQAPFLLANPELIGEALWLETLASYAGAAEVVCWHLRGCPWQEVIAEAALQPLNPPVDLDPLTADLAATIPGFFDSAERWPLPGAPVVATGEELTQALQPRLVQALTTFLLPRRNALTGMFAGALVSRHVNQVYRCAEEDPHLFEWALTEDWRVIESLVEANRLVNVGDDPDAIWCWWELAKAALVDRDQASLTAEELDDLARECGLTLIRLTAPER
ncbi:MAG: hypothetical protein ACE5JG_07280 [Planctomycetota bacterium]